MRKCNVSATHNSTVDSHTIADEKGTRTDQRKKKSKRLETILTEQGPDAAASTSPDHRQRTDAHTSGRVAQQVPDGAPASSSRAGASVVPPHIPGATSSSVGSVPSQPVEWKQTARDDMSYLREFVHQRCVTFSQVGPLAFQRKPDVTTPYQFPEPEAPVVSNGGPHALAVSVRANASFLEQEDVLVSLTRDLMASPPYGDQDLDEERAELLNYLDRELNALQLVKKEQWERQCRTCVNPTNACGSSMEPPFVVTGTQNIYLRHRLLKICLSVHRTILPPVVRFNKPRRPGIQPRRPFYESIASPAAQGLQVAP